MTLRAAAKELVARAAALGAPGRTLRDDEMRLLRAKLIIYPAWLLELLSQVPLCGLQVGWRAYDPEPGFDGVEYVEVHDADGVLSESLELFPGVAIVPSGYVNFGGSNGSGDQYFLCVHEGNDPPLYQVCHDVGSDAETILAEGCRMVAGSLSEFFRTAMLENEGVGDAR